MASSVRVIPATIGQRSPQDGSPLGRRRTAAYAGVSTDSEEQLTSYEAQVDYYTKYIKERADWEFVRVYTDEGTSATNTKKRDGFKQMVVDALAGQIDLIITQSVSRFARNTVDSLVTVRKLKEKGVEVYFEKENIYTHDSKGELLITIMSSLAQEESRSISENVTWGQRKRMADGKISLPYGQFLGYQKGEDGLPRIVESEAEIVRIIFRLFIEGKTPSAIAIWQCNEKYKGDKKCKTAHVTEDDIKQRFLKALNRLMGDREELLANCRLVQSLLCDCSGIDAELAELGQEIEVVTELSKKAIYENARVVISQEEFNERNNSYLERHRKATERVVELESLRRERQSKFLMLEGFIRGIETRPLLLDELDEKLWVVAVETARVMSDGRLLFHFKNGAVVEDSQ